jgi:hypothetical protein
MRRKFSRDVQIILLCRCVPVFTVKITETTGYVENTVKTHVHCNENVESRMRSTRTEKKTNFKDNYNFLPIHFLAMPPYSPPVIFLIISSFSVTTPSKLLPPHSTTYRTWDLKYQFKNDSWQ